MHIHEATENDVPSRELLEHLEEAIDHSVHWATQRALAEDAAWCLWEGMSDDGRKYNAESGHQKAFPWDGASDTRVRLVDAKVREVTRVLKTAARKARLQVRGVEASDEETSMRLQLVLRWLIETKMRPNFDQERHLAAYWRTMLGLSFTLTGWERETALELREIDLMGLLAALAGEEAAAVVTEWAQSAQMEPNAALQSLPAAIDGGQITPDGILYPLLAEVAGLVRQLNDPEQEAAVVTALGQLYPTVTRARMRAVVQTLRETGRAELPSPYLLKDQPYRRALIPMEDVFFPAVTENIQEAPWVAFREEYTVASLREVAELEGWDSTFVEHVLDKGKGMTILRTHLDSRGNSRRWQGGRHSFTTYETPEREHLLEVVRFLYWGVDDMGVRTLYHTVTCPAIYLAHQTLATDLKDTDSRPTRPEQIPYGLHQVEDCPTGQYPLTTHLHYRETKELLRNQGLATLLYTYQAEIKTQRDYRVDYTSLSVLPTVERQAVDAQFPMVWGPGREFFSAQPGSTRFLEPPTSRTADSVLVEQTARRDVNEMTGSLADGELPQPYVQLVVEELIADWLDEEQEVLRQIWAWTQQNLSPSVVTRVAGRGMEPFEVNREDIQGEFDMVLHFDAATLDPETREAKMERAVRLLELDTEGTFNRGLLLTQAMTMVDPTLAEMISEPPQRSREREEEDERRNLAMILAGVEPMMKEAGQNFGLRLQFLKAQVEGEQPNAMLMDHLRRQSPVAELYLRRMQHLTFMVQQQENRKTGRVGVKPMGAR